MCRENNKETEKAGRRFPGNEKLNSKVWKKHQHWGGWSRWQVLANIS